MMVLWNFEPGLIIFQFTLFHYGICIGALTRTIAASRYLTWLYTPTNSLLIVCLEILVQGWIGMSFQGLELRPTTHMAQDAPWPLR